VAESWVYVCVRKKIHATRQKENIKRAERLVWTKITSVEPTRVCNMGGSVVRNQYPATILTGNDPFQAVGWPPDTRRCKGAPCVAPAEPLNEIVNKYTHPLFVAWGSGRGGSLLLHLGVELVDNMRDPRRLEHHLRSITLGFVREFRTQLVDVNILQSHQRPFARSD